MQWVNKLECAVGWWWCSSVASIWMGKKMCVVWLWRECFSPSVISPDSVGLPRGKDAFSSATQDSLSSTKIEKHMCVLQGLCFTSALSDCHCEDFLSCLTWRGKKNKDVTAIITKSRFVLREVKLKLKTMGTWARFDSGAASIGRLRYLMSYMKGWNKVKVIL